MQKWILRISLFLLFLSLSTCKSSESLFGLGMVQLDADAPEVEKLTIKIEKDLIYVFPTINGKTYRFLFDSGAPMVISEELVAEYNCKLIRDASIRDSQGGTQKLEYVLMPDFKLGSRTFSGLTTVAADLSASPVLHCLGIDGIIGANAMQLQYWDFSVADSVLQMSSNKQHWPSGKKYRLPFKQKSSRTPVVSLKINDTDVKDITFDTGSTGILSLPKSMTSSFKPEDATYVARGYLSGGLFGSKIDTAHEYSMRFNFPDTMYHFPVEQEANKPGKLLGMGFLRHFHVYMDYTNQEMLLEPQEIGPEQGTYPIAPYFQSGRIIIGLINNLLPAEYAHLEFGDTLTAINGKPIPEPAELDDFCTVINSMRADSVSIMIRNKGEIHIRRKAVPGH